MARTHASVHRYFARREKATTLLDTLRGLPDFPGRDELETWPPASWEILALLADVNPPSVETQQLVIQMAARRLARAS